jgi:flagellar assembly factor FliW
MIIQTSRFGSVELTEEDIVNFPEGLVGFNSLQKFVLLDDPNDEVFAWLQSCEEPGIAFPVLEPELFATGYNVSLTRHDLEALNLKDMTGSRAFTIVTIPNDATQMTANLKAPVIINVAERIGRQCVLQDSQLNIREPIFTKLQQRVVASPGQPIKNQNNDWGVAIRLPEQPGPGRSAEIK